MPYITAGEWLRQRWEALGFSASSLARRSHVSRRTLSRLAAGGPVSPVVAQILSRSLRLTPEAVDALVASDEVEPDAMARLLGEDPPASPGPLLSLALMWSFIHSGCG